MPELPVDLDDIFIDHKAHRVRIMSKEERETHIAEEWRSYLRQIHLEQIEAILEMMQDPNNKDIQDQLTKALNRSKHFVKRINQMLTE